MSEYLIMNHSLGPRLHEYKINTINGESESRIINYESWSKIFHYANLFRPIGKFLGKFLLGLWVRQVWPQKWILRGNLIRFLLYP